MTIIRGALLALLAVSLAGASGADTSSLPQAPPSPAPAQLGRDAEMALRNRIADEVKTAWDASDFAALDSMADRYVRTRAKTLSGKWRLAVYAAAVADQMSIDWPSEWYLPEADENCRCQAPKPARYPEADRRWNALRARVDDWSKRFPRSPHAQIATAQYLIRRGWFYRGIGVASSVPTAAWRRFHKYIAQARLELESTRVTSVTDPVWFDLMFTIAAAQSWSLPQVARLTDDLFANGQAYAPAYQAAALPLLPKWGGSYAMVEQFARDAITHVDADEGISIYTRIYWQPDQFAAATFREVGADWPTIRQGFDEMIRKYPDPRNVNGKAMFACWAGDREQLAATLKQLGDKVNPDAWIISLSTCKEWLGPDVQ